MDFVIFDVVGMCFVGMFGFCLYVLLMLMNVGCVLVGVVLLVVWY